MPVEKGYHKGQELTMSELGLSLEELSSQPLELFAREGARLVLTVALDTHGQSPWHFTGQASLDLNPGVPAISHTQ